MQVQWLRYSEIVSPLPRFAKFNSNIQCTLQALAVLDGIRSGDIEKPLSELVKESQGAHRSFKTLNTLEFQKSVFKALENLEFFTSP